MCWGKMGCCALFFTSLLSAAPSTIQETATTKRPTDTASLEMGVANANGLRAFGRGRYRFAIARQLDFEPALALLLPWESGAEAGFYALSSQWDLGWVFRLFSNLWIRSGPGVRVVWLSAQEKSLSLNNGTSRQDFYTPGGLRLATNFTWMAGISFCLSDRFLLSFDGHGVQLLNGSRRRLYASVGLGVRI